MPFWNDICNLAACGDNNAVFTRKLEEIKKTYKQMRIIRGDGNCFYRAYMFAIVESVLATVRCLFSVLSSSCVLRA